MARAADCAMLLRGFADDCLLAEMGGSPFCEEPLLLLLPASDPWKALQPNFSLAMASLSLVLISSFRKMATAKSIQNDIEMEIHHVRVLRIGRVERNEVGTEQPLAPEEIDIPVWLARRCE